MLQKVAPSTLLRRRTHSVSQTNNVSKTNNFESGCCRRWHLPRSCGSPMAAGIRHLPSNFVPETSEFGYRCCRRCHLPRCCGGPVAVATAANQKGAKLPTQQPGQACICLPPPLPARRKPIPDCRAVQPEQQIMTRCCLCGLTNLSGSSGRLNRKKPLGTGCKT